MRHQAQGRGSETTARRNARRFVGGGSFLECRAARCGWLGACTGGGEHCLMTQLVEPSANWEAGKFRIHSPTFEATRAKSGQRMLSLARLNTFSSFNIIALGK